MITELHTQIIQQLSAHPELFELSMQKTKEGQFGSRSVSKRNTMQNKIIQFKKTIDNEKLSDKQLLHRVCSICAVDEKQQILLEKTCSASAKEGAIALTNTLLNTINSEQNSEEYALESDVTQVTNTHENIATEKKTTDQLFHESLQNWVTQGGNSEKRSKAADIIFYAYQHNSKELDLAMLGLTTLPSVLSQLTHINRIYLGNNELTTLPDIFKTLSQLEVISLNNNPIANFPKALLSINKYLTINLNDTPMLNTIVTTSLANKIQAHKWLITAGLSSFEYSLFDDCLSKYKNLIKYSKKSKLDLNDYITTIPIMNNNNILEDQEKNVLMAPYFKDSKRIKNHSDLQEKLAPCLFKNLRYISCGDENAPINIFGCARPMNAPNMSLGNHDLENKHYLHNLSFVYKEVDTILALTERDHTNTIIPFFIACAGEKNHQPTKVLSMPILDFIPPRFDHYLTLAEEMSSLPSSTKPKGIFICCEAGEGRTGTLLAAALILDKFKKLDSESRKQLLNTTRDYSPDIFGGTFSHLSSEFKTTSFIGEIVQNLRRSEQETLTDEVGISVETTDQFQTLEILQCMLAISEKLNENPPISDREILEIISEKHFNPEPLEEFFQFNPNLSKESCILEAVKKLATVFHKNK